MLQVNSHVPPDPAAFEYYARWVLRSENLSDSKNIFIWNFRVRTYNVRGNETGLSLSRPYPSLLFRSARGDFTRCITKCSMS